MKVATLHAPRSTLNLQLPHHSHPRPRTRPRSCLGYGFHNEDADEDHLRRYVYRTATNLVFDHFREAKRDRAIAAAEMPPPNELRADRGELRHDMMRVFAELKPQERALLWLAHVEGSSHEEIGEALGVKEKSVKVMLFRARKRLGGLLSKKGLAP